MIKNFISNNSGSFNIWLTTLLMFGMINLLWFGLDQAMAETDTDYTTNDDMSMYFGIIWDYLPLWTFLFWIIPYGVTRTMKDTGSM